MVRDANGSNHAIVAQVGHALARMGSVLRVHHVHGHDSALTLSTIELRGR
jgi:hypothetical protein